jgi:hypothetical protein
MNRILIINLICFLFLLIIIDIYFLDQAGYKLICSSFLSKVCVDDDFPFLELLTAIGTISSGIFAYLAMEQSNKQLKADQTPLIVGPYGVSTADLRTSSDIQLLNVGKGIALKVTVTSDYEGVKIVLKKDLPLFMYIEPDAVVKTIGINSKDVLTKDGESTLYFHYCDIANNKYITIAKFNQTAGANGELVNVSKSNEIYQLTPALEKLL